MLVEHPVDISVIMPVYNAGDYVGLAVGSVLEQDFAGNLELIVVDDGSTDDSFSIVKALARADDTMLIRLISQDHAGVAAARNTGMRYAAGEYVAFLDADDQLMPGFCSHMLVTARTDNADLVIGSRKKLSCGGDMRGLPCDDVLDFGYSRSRAPFDQDFLSDLFWEKDMGISVWNKLYRRDFLGTFSTVQYYEDYPFNLEYISRCSIITAISDIVYCHRTGRGNALDDERYGNCGWEAQIVGDYIIRQFIERISGTGLRSKNLEKADRRLIANAETAIARGVPQGVVENSNRYREAAARLSV